MNPILAGLLPLLITLGLASTVLVTVGAFCWVFLLRQARGDYEPDDNTGDED
jgi:hypothetical protein